MSEVLGACLPGARALGQGAQYETWTPYSLGTTFAFVIILFVGHLPGGLCLEYTPSLFLLPVSHFLLHIFSLENLFF